MEGYGESLLAASRNTELYRAIQEKEAELQGIMDRIAEIDKATPSLSKNPREWEIAAKRAEIGDMSAYDNLVSRGNTDATAAYGIENELYNAEKLTWGLYSKSSSSAEDRAIARSNIEASLRRAEDWARKSGKELPDSYYRLRAALEGAMRSYCKRAAQRAAV
jgi:succinate dehydrogenase/fumarate reductase flavoprotein subunit